MSDFKVGDTLYHHFSTRAFGTGIPTTLAGTPVAEAYEEANATGLTAGVSLTIDHAETGHHLLTVVATGANSFETGKSYGVSLTAGTVDSVSVVGEVIFNFTLEKSPAAQDLANGTDGLGAIKAETALIVADTNELQTDDVPGLIAALNNLSAAEVNAEVDTALITTTYAELAAVPAATSSIKDKINWLFALARNKGTQTSTTKTLRNDADNADIASSTISDDATTFIRGEWT